MMNTSNYRVKDGVESVDGRWVPESRIVTLTPEAARYDLDTGKIEPVAPQKDDPIPKPVPLPAAPEEPADERL